MYTKWAYSFSNSNFLLRKIPREGNCVRTYWWVFGFMYNRFWQRFEAAEWMKSEGFCILHFPYFKEGRLNKWTNKSSFGLWIRSSETWKLLGKFLESKPANLEGLIFVKTRNGKHWNMADFFTGTQLNWNMTDFLKTWLRRFDRIFWIFETWQNWDNFDDFGGTGFFFYQKSLIDYIF